MKFFYVVLVIGSFLVGSGRGVSQDFVNLNFDSATIPAGTSNPGDIPVSDALPGWTAWYGTGPVTSIVYNDVSLAAVSIDLLDSNSSVGGTIPGNNYTVGLQAGFASGSGSDQVSASIAQTGLIPSTAQSILFEASVPSGAGWQLTIAGQNVPVTEISSINGYTGVFVGNIAEFAGQTDQMEFTALAGSAAEAGEGVYLDDISFSTSPAPEPGTLALCVLGGLSLACRRWKKTIEKKLFCTILVVVLLLLGSPQGFSQGFIDLNFEQATIVSSVPYGGGGFSIGTADVPGWTVYSGDGVNYSGGMTVSYNDPPLDDSGISLFDTSYSPAAIQGNYAIFLFGGSIAAENTTNGASIGQTGQIPLGTKSITYWGSGSGFQVSFDGQILPSVAISSTPNYTVWGADISAYADETGELLFTATWPNGYGELDNIQFSTLPVPEPSTLALSTLCILCQVIVYRAARRRGAKNLVA